jgi:hypothetical protein
LRSKNPPHIICLGEKSKNLLIDEKIKYSHEAKKLMIMSMLGMRTANTFTVLEFKAGKKLT